MMGGAYHVINHDRVYDDKLRKVVLVRVVVSVPGHHIEGGVVLEEEEEEDSDRVHCKAVTEDPRSGSMDTDERGARSTQQPAANLLSREQLALKLADDGVAGLSLFKPGHGSKEVARIGKTIGP